MLAERRTSEAERTAGARRPRRVFGYIPAMRPRSGRQPCRGGWQRFGPLLLFVLLCACHPVSDVDKARSLQEAGNFEASLEPLRQAIEARPDDAELHYLYGLALVQTGRPTQAAWSLRRAMEQPEWLTPAGLLLASSALATYNHELALQATDRVLQAEPDNQMALALRAQARIESRVDYEGALSDAEHLLELDPDSLPALTDRAVALLGLERVDEAGAAIEELQRRQGEGSLDAATSARFCATRAVFAKEKGDREKAGELFAQCLDEFPSQAVVVEAALEYYEEEGDAERPIELLRAALEAAPKALVYRSALAGRLRAAGRPDEAEKLLLEATELEGVAPEAAWVELSGHYLALEKYDAMATALERAVEVSTDPAPDLQFALADALILAERYDDALALARRMSLPAHRNLVEGRVYLDEGKPREALEHLTEGLRLWPDNAGARYYAARAAEQLGDFERAIEEYRYSIRADAGATDARYRLALLHEAEGKPQLAVEAALAGPQGPPDLEAQLVALRAAARVGLEPGLRNVTAALRRERALGPRATLAIAEATRDREGPAAAARFLLQSPRLKLRAPGNAELLRALVIYSGAAGESERAAEPVEAALAARPDDADLHEIHGLLLEQRGAPAAEIRAAYTRALELDPKQAQALLALARLDAASGDGEAALALQARAAEAEPDDAEPLRARAELLLALDRPGDAALELEKLLDLHPYDAEAAATLARVRRQRGEADARTLELERRAERFGAARAQPAGGPAGPDGAGDEPRPSSQS